MLTSVASQVVPATQQLEYVSIDILILLTKARSGHKLIPVITDRFSNFTQAVPMKKVGAI